MSTREQEDLAEEAIEKQTEEVFKPHDSSVLPLPPPPGRPAFPFGGLGVGLLKSAAKTNSVNADLQKSWTDHDFSMYLGQSSTPPRDRIRELDRLRFHNLHPEDECVLLRLPSRRVDIQSLKDVIMLCGGLVGVRFESSELRLISGTCSDLERTWVQLDRLYKSMPSAVTKMGSSSDIDMQQTVEDFHALCDNYIRDLQNIQDLIKLKQATIDRTVEPMKIEADPSSNVGSPYPKWLMILRAKFEAVVAKEKADAAGEASSPISSASQVFPLGKFSVFLCLSLQGRFEFSVEEKEALSEVRKYAFGFIQRMHAIIVLSCTVFFPDQIVEASRDCEEIFTNMSSVRTTSSEQRAKYFAKRFFTFLKSIPELKSSLRDEASIDKLAYV